VTSRRRGHGLDVHIRPRVVIISHICPFPPVHGNRTRFIGLLAWLKKRGFAITFILQPLDVDGDRGVQELGRMVDRLDVVPRPAPSRSLLRSIQGAVGSLAQALLPDPIADRLRRVARTTTSGGSRSGDQRADLAVGGRDIDDWCWPTTCEAVRRAVDREQPLAVIAEYALLSKCLEGLPATVVKVIDTVEVFFRNPDRFEKEGLEAPAVCTPASEKRALARADVLVAIQRNDARALQECFPAKRIITVSHSAPQIIQRSPEPVPGTILYVGSSNVFNVHGLREFLDRAWPDIASRVPEVTFRIVGSVPRVDGPDDARILHIGRVTDEQLAHEYRTANVVINPQVAGTGLKIKCVEALSAGCPLVTNPAGADGLEAGAGSAFLLARDWNEFAQHVVKLLRDPDTRRGLEAQASVFARRMFSLDATFAELENVLGTGRSARYA
jgi:glycosyltransferase involved in cell wall biosynthesis